MKHQISAALHFKHLVRQIPRAVLVNESNRLLQTFPLRFPIQDAFAVRLIFSGPGGRPGAWPMRERSSA